MKKGLLYILIIFPIFSLCLKIKSEIMFLFFIPSLHKQNGNNNKIKIPVKNYKTKEISHHYLFNKNINNTNFYMSNCVNAKKKRINNLHFLITSPEAAKIYRLVIILLIYYLKKNIMQSDDTKNCISIKNKDKNNINTINKLVNIPIISIGLSTNYMLNNKLKKNDFYNIYKNMSLENKKKYDINNYEFNKINKSLKNFNITFTPSISNADTLKRELSLHYFQKQIKLSDLKQKNSLINVIWLSSAISMSNFENIKSWNIEKKQNYNIKNINVMRINCYDTKSINYSKQKLKKIKIKKNSIVCLMSNSAVLSFYQNFGNNFNYVVCMGKNCYLLLKKLNFINVYYPMNSKLELLLNMLVKLHRKITKKMEIKIEKNVKKKVKKTNANLEANLGNTTSNNYENEIRNNVHEIDTQNSKCMNKQIKVVLTREKHKNYQIKKFLLQKNIPIQIIPCIKTEYKHKEITHLCNTFLSHIQEDP
ncbi:conserved Plasmodium protein, unknown function [Plasmodium berghei]|uniref:Uroporphyrinogen-III synthase n=2 Tax=Plasmodium berghei TaxID=5821 RepID=A0A509ARH6_PLABA|nr:conserved Plasmodium protein, unknown function [Plasmodium berghei ANKA]CXJ28824.1 conserved Plasmodium protein, unknown function [Plasmodium berghei]SCM27061.1 conserved Plasmodium protein, unknown function [Plasmodium berghei]SCN28787.1 conserved Plasmodium protein, unknown function [Plasmodium berghei]SCO63072.1 conserved Plasmodium protein, unknown function [Plasmodium berghei]SCO64534.1 conserved Plasmodium protein, unknown function [Plasmodium berghei]|eukprot:XP_034424433.1 conserved Plasmodium protein, unknown function [Plasmodium berghei ANKA]